MDKAAAPSRQSQRGLDWFIFFLADVQTGFGPFIAVYLTTQKWTQAEIGLVLSIGGVVGLIGQMPGGAIVDAARSERLVAGLAVATDRHQRAGLCGVADLSRGGDGGDAACGGELRARSGDRRDQPWSGRTAGDRRAARAQRPLCLAGQRRCRGRDGHLRLSAVEPFGVPGHLHPGDSDLAGARRASASGEIDAARAHGAVLREVPDASATSVFSLVRQRPLADFRRRRAAAATRQRGDAAADGGRGNDPVKPVGAGADRRLHHRAAGDRGAGVAVGRDAWRSNGGGGRCC